MKRLPLQIGITYLSVLAVVFYMGTTWAWILGAVFLLALIITLLVSRFRTTIYLPVIAAVALIACVVNILYTDCVYYKTIEKYNNYSGTVSATLKEEPYKFYGSYCYEFTSDSIGDETCSVKFALFYDELLDIEPFDKVTTQVTLSDFANAKLMSEGCFLTADFIDDEPLYTVYKPEHKPLYYWAIRIRQYIRQTLKSALSDDTASLCNALLIGDKYTLSDDVRQDFVKAGVSHLVVVSGMHFSMLVSLFFLFAKRKYRYRLPWLILAIVFILVYMAITGFSPSVMRSGIMLLIYTVGCMIGREHYSLNSLGIAALAVTAFNPYSVGNVGLILSFATTLSIVTLTPSLCSKFYFRIYRHPNKNKFIKFCRKILYALVNLLCVNFSAFLASLPLSILFFDGVSTVSVISTFVLYYPTMFLLVLSLVLSLTFFIPLFAPLLCMAIEWLSQLFINIVSLFASLPFSYLYVRRDFVYLWLVMSLLLFAFMYITKSKDRVKVLALSSTLILLVGYLSATLITASTTTLNVYSVDNGCAVTYSSAGTSAVLSLDCNKSNALSTISKMKKSTTKVDFYSSVSDTTNSLNSLVNCSEEFAISSVLLYDTKRDVSLPNTIVDVATPGDVYTAHIADAVVTYYLVSDVYITYLDSAKGSVLILPQFVDVSDIPETFRTADTIIMGNCPLNFGLLSCDTLVISASAERAYNIMNFAHSISERVLLTAQGDVSIVMEV